MQRTKYFFLLKVTGNREHSKKMKLDYAAKRKERKHSAFLLGMKSKGGTTGRQAGKGTDSTKNGWALTLQLKQTRMVPASLLKMQGKEKIQS